MAAKESGNGGNWCLNLGDSSGLLAASLVLQDVEKDGHRALRRADARQARWQAVGQRLSRWHASPLLTPSSHPATMLNGLVLFYVGAVLILSGLWLLDRIGDREILVINALVGLLSQASR